MKQIFTFILGLIISTVSFGQCTIVPFSLEKRVNMADVVVEAKVIHQRSFWNDKQNFIYTSNVLRIQKIFKGEVLDTDIELLTEGGMVDLTALVVEPSLQVKPGEVGVFLLKKSDLKFKNSANGYYQPVASVQSFIAYDLTDLTAHDYFQRFENVPGILFPKIEAYTQVKYKTIGKDIFSTTVIKPLSAPIITSIDKDTFTAGNGQLLTITGSNFGIIKGKGYMEFVDPNYGDGRYKELHYPTSFKSWSNSKIEVYVPPRAGTGKFRITNNSGETTESSQSIVIRYAHSNYPFVGQNGVDSGYYEPRHIDLDGNGGYEWTMSKNFIGKTNAVNAFYRSAENWRCATRMNWGINTTSSNVQEAVKDGINIVHFTEFGDSRLGVCGSWYGGCFVSGTVKFYVSELDISFDSTRNWYYGENKPAVSQYDFETVATHELGHGHQLSHVIDKTKIMHYSLTNGERKTVLHADDIEGGSYVRDQSGAAKVCNNDLYKPIAIDDCNITKPKAKFEVNIPAPCPNTDVRFTDKTEGKVTQYAWDFGDDASVATATGSGPYILKYSSSGTKTVRLIVSNDFGSDTFEMALTVVAGPPESPASFAHDTACVGAANSVYTINTVENATGYEWTLSNGGTVQGFTNDTVLVVDWKATGNYTLDVIAKNTCGSSAPRTETVTVILDAKAGFDITPDGMDFTFTNTSTEYTSLSWSFGDGDVSTDMNPSHTYATRGEYTVRLVAQNVCSTDTLTKTVDAQFNVGVSDLATADYGLMPNPAQGSVVINALENVSVRLINNAGQTVLYQPEVVNGEKVSLKNLTPGAYTYILLTKEGKQQVGRLMVQ